MFDLVYNSFCSSHDLHAVGLGWCQITNPRKSDLELVQTAIQTLSSLWPKKMQLAKAVNKAISGPHLA